MTEPSGPILDCMRSDRFAGAVKLGDTDLEAEEQSKSSTDARSDR
jgi:hypothetical protein